MVQSAPNQRYQSADEVWQDLILRAKLVGKNQPIKPVVAPLPPPPQIIVHQVSPPVVASPPASKSQVDLELAEVRAQFGNYTPPNPIQPVNRPTPSSKSSQSPVDLELEELKSQFLGSTTPKNPPHIMPG
jgi:hypothetical protein